jgi:hypothetical protein
MGTQVDEQIADLNSLQVLQTIAGPCKPKEERVVGAVTLRKDESLVTSPSLALYSPNA